MAYPRVRTVTSGKQSCAPVPAQARCESSSAPVCDCPLPEPPELGLIFHGPGQTFATSNFLYRAANESIHAPIGGQQTVRDEQDANDVQVWDSYEIIADPLVGNGQVLGIGSDRFGTPSSMPVWGYVWGSNFASLGCSIGNVGVAAFEFDVGGGVLRNGMIVFKNILFTSRIAVSTDITATMFGGVDGMMLRQEATADPAGNPPAGFMWEWLSPVSNRLTRKYDDGTIVADP